MEAEARPSQDLYEAGRVSKTSSSSKKKAITIGTIVRVPSGSKPEARGFRKNRLKAGVERYHSGSTTASDGQNEELEEDVPCGVLDASKAPQIEDNQMVDPETSSPVPPVPRKSKAAKFSRGAREDKNQDGLKRRGGRHRTFKAAASERRASGFNGPRVQDLSERRLSFANVSMAELWGVIEVEATQMDWMAEFWQVVLAAPYPAACKTLSMRSLGSWVAIYNKWQALGAWKPGQAPHFFNAFDAQQILGISWTRVMELIELFDQANADNPEDHVAVQLPVHALMAVFVMMSKVICKRHKIRFLLGIFDEHDRRLFSKDQFVNMLMVLFHGLSAMFEISDSSPEHTERIENFASQLFRRMLNIYEDQKGEMMDDGSTSLPFSLIEDWLLGHTDDPLNLPFVLLVERFSVPGQEEDPEIFEDEGRKFCLSHMKPVELPLDTALSLDSKMMSRHEVIVVQKIFSHGLSMGSFDISHADAERALDGLPMDFVDLWMERLQPALDLLEESKVQITLSGFLKQLCPKATQRHLRMFRSWIREFEDLQKLKLEVEDSCELLSSFKESLVKPLLPATQRQELLNKWTREQTSEDFQDYLCAHCPCTFRPVEGDPLVNETIVGFLEHHLIRQEQKIQQMERLFSPRLEQLCKAEILKKTVPKIQWQKWNEALDLLDFDDEEKFRTSRLLPTHVRALLLRLVGDSHVNRARILKLFCEVFNYRKT